MVVFTDCSRNVSLPQILWKNMPACVHSRGSPDGGSKVRVSWVLHERPSGSLSCEITWSREFKKLSRKAVG